MFFLNALAETPFSSFTDSPGIDQVLQSLNFSPPILHKTNTNQIHGFLWAINCRNLMTALLTAAKQHVLISVVCGQTEAEKIHQVINCYLCSRGVAVH